MDGEIETYGKSKGIRPRTLQRWLRLSEPDRKALLDLACQLGIGENHLRDILEWTEEMNLRDGVSLWQVIRGATVEPIWTDPGLGRSEKIRRVKEELRRLRFPRLVRAEREIQKRVRSMGLKSEIQISVPPALEGGFLTVHLKSTSYEDLQRLVAELGPLVDRSEIREVFSLLNGEAI